MLAYIRVIAGTVAGAAAAASSNSSASEIGTQYIVPSIGLLLIWLSYLSSIFATRKVSRKEDLGEINPYPAVIQIFNGVSWVIYGATVPIPTSLYCFIGNFIGVVIGVYYVLVYNKFAPEKTAMRMQFLCVALTLIYVFFYWFIVYFLVDITTIFGYFAVVINVIYYYAPLLTIVKVIRTRNAESIYVPLTVTFLICSAMWVAYGFTIGDYFIAAPNVLGLLSALVQLLLKIIFQCMI